VCFGTFKKAGCFRLSQKVNEPSQVFINGETILNIWRGCFRAVGILPVSDTKKRTNRAGVSG